jgi:potassium-transporting ATPase potassium-binding subunit
MLAFTVQNFVSAATGMAVLVALIRGFGRASVSTIGNFWTDLVRTTLYIPENGVRAVILADA